VLLLRPGIVLAALLTGVALAQPVGTTAADPARAAPGAFAMDLQGHRGARGLFPENTLEGFARTLAIGVSTLELDCAITADGVVVISHDPRLNPDITRGPDGKWLADPAPLIATLSFETLQRYDVGRIDPGTAYARTFATQQPIDGARIPRLADLFALVAARGDRDVRFNIETKIDPAAPDNTPGPVAFANALLKEVRKAGVEARTTIQSFDWRTLAIVAREAPEVQRAYLSTPRTLGTDAGESVWTAGVRFRDHPSGPRMVKAAGGRLWSPGFATLGRAVMDEARALGIAVVPWTVNTPEDIERMLDLGVDGIISDYPDRVRNAMIRRGLAVPLAR